MPESSRVFADPAADAGIERPIFKVMSCLRVSAALALALAVPCSGERPAATVLESATGQVIGHVRVVSPPARRLATAGVYPGRVVGLHSDRETSELDNVIVFLNTTLPPGRAQQASIRQTNEEFVPHVVAVTAGSTVDFPNDDPIFHNVFSLSRAATFDLGRYPRNTSKARTFAKPGIVKVYCHLHSHMSAIVRVFPHSYFTVPDRSGRFRIANVPAGRAEVTAWHERSGEVTQVATLVAGGTAELSFSLPLTESE
jgi:plastocyanin